MGVFHQNETVITSISFIRELNFFVLQHKGEYDIGTIVVRNKN